MQRRDDLTQRSAARVRTSTWFSAGSIFLALAMAPLLVIGEEPPALPTPSDLPGLPAAKSANATNRFTIRGMHCQACAKGLTSELKRVAGVATAEVSFTNRLAVVAYDTNRVAVPTLLSAIKEAGFEGQLAKRPSRR